MQSEGDGTGWAAKYSAWEFVHCGICYLPFINPRNPEAPPAVPFWLTECSHVVCNNHLNADQTCRQCADGQHIELMPLQLELPEPMSKWFQPIPDALLDLNGATKFQYETMKSLIRFYKGKCTGQKELIERLRREVDSLKAEASWRQEMGSMRIAGDSRGNQGYDFINENGKRRRFEGGNQGPFAIDQDSRQHYSTLSVDPGYGASRLTLRPGSSRLEQEQGRSYLSNSSGDRPRKAGRSSPISLEKFAYQPPDHGAERGHTARASTGNFNATLNGAPTPRSVGRTDNFSASSSQLKASSNTALHASTSIERFKELAQMPIRRGDELSNQPSAARQRFHPIPPSTPLRNANTTNPSLGPARMAPPLNLTRALNTATGSRRFVPPTPTQQSLNLPPSTSAQQSRMRSQSQMPPPPLPGSSRFR